MHIIAVIFGQLLDLIIGDPPKMPHPIKWIGSFIALLSKKLNSGRFRIVKGAFTALFVIGVVTGITFTIVMLSYKINIFVGLFIEMILIAIGLAQKSLKEAAMIVYDALDKSDLDEARLKLSWIVGRDTEHLEEPEIVRGVVETVSENTSDGVTAPLFYAILFGATGLWAYKAINTLDSMIGYKNETYMEFGKVAARLDDIANFIPSRITGFLLLLTKNKTNRNFVERFKRWLVDAKKHPSPNSGFLEAATAYQLGIQLGGFNTYKGITSFRAHMGVPEQTLQKEHIKDAITQMFIVSWLFLIIVGGVYVAVSFPWSEL